MTEVTYFVALAFLRDDTGIPVTGKAEEFRTPTAAIRRAESLSRAPGFTGAVALSCMGDPELDKFAQAIVLRKFGEVPGDLSGLLRRNNPHARRH